MPLTPGQTLSFYEILGSLGAGAMGEVYRARDSRLQREVAIKVLPEHFADDEERLRRFEREARTLASVNHPNVAQIFGVDQIEDTCFLVLELVEGEALEDRLARGALPIAEALDVCRQIASGLEAAHEAGVIHRDLKPANVRLTPEGRAKVLDFGLAKPSLPGKEGSSTDSVLSTEAGRLLGTPTHMAPEQARGKQIDRRVDVWAFGCVLFECLTGRRTFDGESLSDVLAAVLEREPNWKALPAGVPPRVKRLLERCLTKDPYERLRDIGDARIELTDALARRDDTPSQARASGAAERGGAKLAWGVAACASALALWLALRTNSTATVARESAQRVSIDLPPNTTLATPGNLSFDVSDDGRWIVFFGVTEAGASPQASTPEPVRAQLYVRALDRFECTPLPDTENATGPFFSPDAEWIAYFDEGAGKLRKVPRSGGASLDLCDSPENSRGGGWSKDGTIVFTRGATGGLYTVPDSGGEPKPLAIPNWSKGQKSYRHPQFLPDGKHVLATLSTSTLATYDDADIVRISLETGDVETVFRGGETPHYAASGHLAFARAGRVHAVAYDLATGRTSGTPFVVQDDVLTSDNHGTAQYALSNEGTLVFLPGGPEDYYSEFAWIDANGARGETLDVEPAEQFNVEPSRDGRLLAFQTAAGNDFLQVYDTVRRVSTRLVTGGWDCALPIWSENDEHLVFALNRGGSYDLYRQRADGSEPPELLLASEHTLRASDVTPDGRFVVYHDIDLANRGNVMLLPLDENGRAGTPKPLLTEPYDERHGVVSPDGKWIAYVSDESGEHEVYVRPFPEGARRWQLSRSGGVRPRWSRDGTRLFHLNGEGLVELDLSKGPESKVDTRLVQAWDDWFELVVVETVGGERLLGARAAERVQRTSLGVVLDVFAELKRPR